MQFHLIIDQCMHADWMKPPDSISHPLVIWGNILSFEFEYVTDTGTQAQHSNMSLLIIINEPRITSIDNKIKFEGIMSATIIYIYYPELNDKQYSETYTSMVIWRYQRFFFVASHLYCCHAETFVVVEKYSLDSDLLSIFKLFLIRTLPSCVIFQLFFINSFNKFIVWTSVSSLNCFTSSGIRSWRRRQKKATHQQWKVTFNHRAMPAKLLCVKSIHCLRSVPDDHQSVYLWSR